MNPIQLTLEAEEDKSGLIVQNATASNGLYVSTKDKEKLTYNVDITQGGTYSVVARVASAQNTFTGIGVTTASGQQRSSQFNSTGGSTNWQNVNVGYVNLSAGKQTLSLNIYGGNFNLDSFQLNFVDTTTTTVTPSSNSSVATPSAPTGTTRIEAENDKSGLIAQNVTASNGSYVTTTDKEKLTYSVNIAQAGTYSVVARVASAQNTFTGIGVTTASGQQRSSQLNSTGGSYVSTTDKEKLTYNVNITQAGTYSVVAHVASAQNTFMGIGVTTAGGQQRSSPFNSTGGSTNWQDVNVGYVNLNAGQQALSLNIYGGNFNLDYFELKPIDSSTSQQQTQTPQTYKLGNVINSRFGSNNYTGGNGTDTISYAHSTSGINADLSQGVVYHLLASSSSPLKIMAVGDSITAGLTPTPDRPGVEIGGYRDKLRELLANNGFQTNFVGPASNGPDPLDQNHAGYSGYTVVQIAQTLNPNNVLGTYQPDKVLLMAGTNNITMNSEPNNAPAQLTNLIDQITTQLPDAQVVVASIPTIASYRGETFPQQVAQYNSAIPGIVNSEVAKGKNVSYADIFNAVSVDDLVDGIHPGDAGNTKIAQTWYNALLESNSGKDTLSNFKNIIGSKYNDTIKAGNDNSIIDGGGGDDLLTGGSGRNTFVLAAGRQGTATITNFTEGKDLLGLSNGLQFNQLSITQGTDSHLPSTSINYNGQQLALLKGVQASTISSSDFVYA